MNTVFNCEKSVAVGVGLRHPHYAEALAHFQDIENNDQIIDFVEVHSENFFAQGGATRALIKQVAEHMPISLHSTAMGLGSQAKIPGGYLDSLNELVNVVDPILMSDHAAFSWCDFKNKDIHAGDLLPIAFNDTSLKVMSKNVDAIQQKTGRRILIENLSAYIKPEGSTLSETEFLVELAERTQCGLLVDLNNLLVNGSNFSLLPELDYAKNWLKEIPQGMIGEIHLAGYSQVEQGNFIIDDHSQAVSDSGWELYKFALAQFGAIPTLVEWDNNLPSWNVLINEASKAKAIANQVFSEKALSDVVTLNE